MILQALTEYYQALEREGKIAAPGWSPVKVSFALCREMTERWSRLSPCRRNSRGARRLS